MKTNTGGNDQRRFTIEGESLAYPTEFRDGCSSVGLFAVPDSVANRLIEDTGFELALIAPGKALLNLICVHYTDSDCGVYNEIALAFLVKKNSTSWRLPYLSTWRDLLQGQVASYTWRLPVTSTLARDAGILMWGFPKHIADIRFERIEGDARFSWYEQGSLVLSYSVPAQGKREPATISPPVYSLIEGKAHVSYLTQTYRDVGYNRAGVLKLGAHQFAKDLRNLGLPKKPLIASWNGHLAFKMSAPELLPA